MMKTFDEIYNELAGETIVDSLSEQSTKIQQRPHVTPPAKKFSAKDFLYPPKTGSNEPPHMRPGHSDPAHVFSQHPAPIDPNSDPLDPGATTIDTGKTTDFNTPIEPGEFRSFVADMGQQFQQFGDRLGGIENRLTKAGI
jgi:hypothetical protein